MEHSNFISKKKLADLFLNYKYISLATPVDNEDLLEFFKSMTMETSSFSLRYDRGEEFFAFTREQSEKNTIFVIRDEEGKIKGCANVALIPHLIDGKKSLCAYLGDLRITPALNPRIRLQWKKFYSDLIENFHELEEFHGVDYLYSAILDENKMAARSLLKNEGQIIYHPISSYETFNVIRPLPHARFQQGKYSAVTLSLAEAKTFLIEESKKPGMQHFVSNNERDELDRRMETWTRFANPEFLAVKDNNGKCVAICAPRTSETKKLVVEKMSSKQKVISLILPLLNVPSFKEKGEIKTLYLTHLTLCSDLPAAEIPFVMNAMLVKLFSEKKNIHSISFFTWPQWNLKKLPYIIEKTQATLFQVTNRKLFEEGKILDLQNRAPAFEIGIA